MNTTTDYDLLMAQARALTDNEPDALANLANLAALTFATLDNVNWAGFYVLRGDELVLGPFQGQSACVRIPLGQGVCGTAAANAQALRVADVHEFEGHIACDAASESEIVIPLMSGARVIGVLDIDSPLKSRFSAQDEAGLTGLAALASKLITNDPRTIGLVLSR
ncbi:MAG: GAF domain-containing protein [Pseudomonadota bacterium]